MAKLCLNKMYRKQSSYNLPIKQQLMFGYISNRLIALKYNRTTLTIQGVQYKYTAVVYLVADRVAAVRGCFRPTTNGKSGTNFRV